MKLLHVLSSICLATQVSLVSCQSQNETFIADEIAKIPACGLSCLEMTIPAVGCDILNTTCQCESQRLIKITAQCMMANCTLEESVELDKIQADICERPYQSRNHLIRVMTIVCTIITNTAILVRLVTRYFLNQQYRLDDFFIIAAACTDAVFTSFGVQFEHHGFGEHVWEINISIIPQLLYWFYLCEVFYVITITLVKISILIFYLQVFRTRTFRIRCWSVLGFVVVSSFVFTVVTIFQCHPISSVWKKDLQGGKCINYNSVAWANGAINIVQDLLIITLPISEVRKLQLGQKKKIGLYIMFGLGGFVCITSMVRLYSIKYFGLTSDPTWDNIPITFWSTLETTTAVLCSCLPTIRAGLLRLFPQVFGSSTVAFNSIPAGNKPTILVQKSFASSSTAKSWPAQKLVSVSSLNTRNEETPTATNHRDVIQDLELAKLSHHGF